MTPDSIDLSFSLSFLHWVPVTVRHMSAATRTWVICESRQNPTWHVSGTSKTHWNKARTPVFDLLLLQARETNCRSTSLDKASKNRAGCVSRQASLQNCHRNKFESTATAFTALLVSDTVATRICQYLLRRKSSEPKE